MKILYILHFPPPVHGSAVVGSYIKDNGVINESFNCRYINLGISETVEDIGHKGFGKLVRYLSLLWNVKKQLLIFRPDLCYLTINSTGTGFYKDVLVVLLVKIFGVKPVYHFHNKGVSRSQNKFFDNLLYRFVFRNAEIILLSKFLYPDIRKYVPESRVRYCPNGIPEINSVERRAESVEWKELRNERRLVLRSFKEEGTESLERKEGGEPVELLFLSHLIKSKGVLVLINACEILRDKGADFHCSLAGGDAELTRQDVQDVITGKKLSSFITISGPVYGEEKMNVMSAADIFVHPSFNDCLPLIILESMQYSLPIVSTFEGAIPEVVEDGVTGFLVPQKDSNALAEKLELLIKDPELRLRMGRAGREKYEKEFTLTIFEKRMKEILEELILKSEKA